MAGALLAKDNIKATNVVLMSEKMSGAIAMLLPDGQKPSYIVQVAINAMMKSPQLAECTPLSIAGAVLMAAQLHLPPDGRVAALVPYYNNEKKCREAQFQPMYKGLVQLMYRSGMITDISSGQVYEGDLFEWERGSQKQLRHKPLDNNGGMLTHAWAMYTTTNGGWDFKVLDRARIDYHKSHAKQQATWKQHYPEMAEKSALIELSKAGPFSVDVMAAVQLDEAASQGRDQQLTRDVGQKTGLTEEDLVAFVENPTVDEEVVSDEP